MAQIGNVTGINAVKQHLNTLKDKGLVKEWELPYENVLTRLSAAIFFLTPVEGTESAKLWEELEIHNGMRYRLNDEKKLSLFVWRVEFDQRTDA